MFEVTKISSKDRILLRTGDQTLWGFAQDRVQQRLVVPEMVEQLEKVPKMVSQSGIQRRTAEHIVDRPGPVLPERISDRMCGQSGVIEVTYVSNRDQNLQRTVERTCVDSVDESVSQIMEESFEAVLPEREQSGVLEVTETSSPERNLQRTVEQTQITEESFEADKIVLPEQIPEWICEPSGVIEVTETSSLDRNLQYTVVQTEITEEKVS